MILGVDASRAAGPRAGVGRVLEYLLRSWSRQELPFEQVRVLSSAPISDLPDDDRLVPDVVPGGGPGPWWQLTRLRPRAQEVDVFFAPYTLPLGFRGRSVVYNLGIYEGPYAIPGWRARAHSQRMARSARRADRVLAICPTNKADLVRHYGVPAGKISVVWPGLDPRFRPLRAGEEESTWEAIEGVLGGRDPYFLFVGKLSRRRNVPALLEAFAEVAGSRPDLRLLLLGPNTANVPVDRITADLRLEDRVLHRVDVGRENLVLLYRGARAFVMPSESEGFSLTILEAMASGCPTLTLKGAPLGVLEYLTGPRDHAGGGPVLEAPDARAASLASALQRLAHDDELCAELGRRGERFAATFPSWDDTAAEVMEALAEVAGSERSRLAAGAAGHHRGRMS